MKIALLGAAGFVGRAAAAELARRPEVEELILVDYMIRDAKKMAKRLSPKCRYAMADAGKPSEFTRLLEGVSAVANAVGPCREYEETILTACASMKINTASIGDNRTPPEDHRKIHDAFRQAGAVAVSGCGMMPGWTDLLAAHFLGNSKSAHDDTAANPPHYLFFSPDRFGGYAFMREFARQIESEIAAPREAPPGRYYRLDANTIFGVPEKKAGGLIFGIANTMGKLGTVGKEFSAAMMLWTRGLMTAPPGTPVAVCYVTDGKNTARLEDTSGNLAGILLAEATVRLGSLPLQEKGLVSLHTLISLYSAHAIASKAGAVIKTSSVATKPFMP
ncbi:MAG: saccharopine dehydrogenase NADP-binding domain-containing protein [Syntrophorhabdaceae bacterium]|nr:saccharopine dehydrogenase NADP-binding domain-containing protein [Syntrophorhabdaceae bacterium]